MLVSSQSLKPVLILKFQTSLLPKSLTLHLVSYQRRNHHNLEYEHQNASNFTSLIRCHDLGKTENGLTFERYIFQREVVIHLFQLQTKRMAYTSTDISYSLCGNYAQLL